MTRLREPHLQTLVQGMTPSWAKTWLNAADRMLSTAAGAMARLGDAVSEQDRDTIADLVRRHDRLIVASERHRRSLSGHSG
jgi:hypothetical protein